MSISKPKLICITVSTKYDDILKICLPHNAQFFDKWYIITDRNDNPTINLIRSFDRTNIEILFFDFYHGGVRFNKGGAIRMGQLHVEANHPNCNILLLDSDIYLPDNFSSIMENIIIEENTLYGVEKRIDYYFLKNFRHNKPSREYNLSKEFVGFFQLYNSSHRNKYLYEDSYNCAICDNKFVELFDCSQRIIIEGLHVKHLGRPEINWDSRRNRNDFSL